MNIFVGNLSFDANGGDVKKLFEGFGNVAFVVIVMRKEKKAPKSRGFGFVQMPDEQQALAAIAAFNGKEFMGRVLDVSPARPKTEAHREMLSLGRNPQEMLNLGVKAMGVRKNPGLKVAKIRTAIKDEVKVMGRLIYGIGKHETLS